MHHFTIKPVIYGTIAAKAARVPLIFNTVTGLGYVFTDQSRVWLKSLVKALYRLAFFLSDHVFFQNGDDERFFAGRTSKKGHRVTILPGSGVDCERFKPVISKPKSDLSGSLTFLMISRLLKDKGIYEFVNAGRMVKRKFPNVEFLLLGRRDERNPSVIDSAELDKWQAEDVVKWLGEADDVRPILAKADVVVLPSYREGTPRALLEASAMGKPLIATDVTGCREVVANDRTGLLVPVKNPKALAEAMCKMIENPGMRAEMGKEGRRKMEKEFDEKIVIGKILEVYHNLLQSRAT